MDTLEGKSARGGIAIAVAAVITSKLGIGGVSPDILQQGVNALRQRLPPPDYPEVVVICDKLAVGAATKIPGVNTIGIAAESAERPEGQEPDVPAVVGVSNLLKSVAQGQIVIVDGERGVVRIDPDSNAIAAYQQVIERNRSHPVFLESKHLPAKTQTGQTVLVYARASSATDLARAVEEGADGVVVEPFETEAGCFGTEGPETTHEIALMASLGKPVAFPASFVDKQLIRASMRLAAPGQVHVLFPASHFERLAEKMAAAVEEVAHDPADKELKRAEIIFGGFAGYESALPDGIQVAFALVDMRTVELSQAADAVAQWLNAAKTIVFDIGDRIKLLEAVVTAGARGIVTVPRLVTKIKDAVRGLGVEEME